MANCAKPTVVKSNQFIRASYKLSAGEQKVILALASHIKLEDDDFKEYTFAIKDFMELVGVKNKGKYREIQDITKGLIEKAFEFRDGKKLVQVAWLSGAIYHEGEGRVTITFHHWLKPYLLQLKSQFTKYRLENVIQLKSSYSIRLYELLKSWEYIGQTVISIDELRNMLYLDIEYPMYKDFKRNVILVALKELSQKTDLTFDFEEIKTSRKVTSLKFTIKNNSKKYEIQEMDIFNMTEDTVDGVYALLEGIRFRLKDEFGFKTITINSLLKKYDPEYINANLDISLEAFKSGKATNLQAYARAAIRDDYRKQLTPHEIDKASSKEQVDKATREAVATLLEQAATTDEIQSPELAGFAKRLGITKWL